MQAAVAFQQGEQFGGQGTNVAQLLRIPAGRRAEQQIAHVIGGGIGRPQTGGLQLGHQGSGTVLAYTTQLQVGPVGQLQDPARPARAGGGDGPGLG